MKMGIGERRVVFLEAVRALVRRGWCQWKYAVDKDGLSIDKHSRFAVAWCLVGACNRVQEDASKHPESASAMDCVRAGLGGASMSAWNDRPGRTKAEVIVVLGKAITLARSKIRRRKPASLRGGKGGTQE